LHVWVIPAGALIEKLVPLHLPILRAHPTNRGILLSISECFFKKIRSNWIIYSIVSPPKPGVIPSGPGTWGGGYPPTQQTKGEGVGPLLKK